MLEDVQGIIFKDLIFTGGLPCVVDRFYLDDQCQNCVFHCFDRSREMVKAALVCKSWNQAYRDYLQVFFAEEDEKLRLTAIDNGLAMCTGTDLPGVPEPQLMEEIHIVQFKKWRQDFQLLNLHLTRWKPDDSALPTLAVQYAVRSLDADDSVEMTDLHATRLTQIPQLFLEHPASLGEDESNEAEQWGYDFIQQTWMWLPTQRDAEDQVDAIETWKQTFDAWRVACSKQKEKKRGRL